MQLHEEYIHRHNLDVPVVRYDSSSQIILRSKESPLQWRIISCRWRTNGYHPGYFEVSCKKPVRNGHYQDNALKNVAMDNLYWDDYERKILNLVSNMKNDYVAISDKESDLAAWEIFLLIYDTWLSQNMPKEFYEHVCESIDWNSSYSSRKRAYRNSLMYIKGSDVCDAYIYQIKWLSSRHSKWLEDLVNV